jgi:murein DD-endopeptidase MepM/ murein hydrolase activator NlpD
VAPGQSLLELAVLHNSNPWSLVVVNSLNGIWAALPSDVLRIPNESAEGPGALPASISAVEVTPLPLTQGKTTVVRLATGTDLSLTGTFTEHNLHFFSLEAGKFVALQGVHALTEPGFYPLTLSGILPDGATFTFSQRVYVRDGQYPYDPPLLVDPTTIDPAVTKPEDDQWAALAQPVTPEKLWNGAFQNPSTIPLSAGFPSLFGNRRSYNGGTYDRFHTGLDLYGDTGTDVYAPAAGEVVFAGALTVRGNTVMINHGWGVYTGYMHLSEIKVAVGEGVTAGQVVGLAGKTGRVSGPHLHFEVWVGGVQVDPLDWLNQVYP